MKLYIAIPLLVLAMLFAAAGIAAVTRGWVVPTSRRWVRNPRRYGWGVLLLAAALLWQILYNLAGGDTGPLPWGIITGGVLQVTGLLIMFASQRQPRHDSDTRHTS
ncbi:hypothetical protein [Kitasatospora sp. NPDC002040]|uniref:hypothetical protein n=1 Tax=Kitasatospora sp. NPDC002040 TaxID=3154661 RepID=UPI00332F52BC